MKMIKKKISNSRLEFLQFILYNFYNATYIIAQYFNYKNKLYIY